MKLGWIGSIWPVDWEERVVEAVQGQGHPSVRAFVEAHPGEGFEALSRRLDKLAPSGMIHILYLRDANVAGELRAAAYEGLLRLFQDFTPTGWKNYGGGLTPGSREIDMVVTWEEYLKIVSDQPLDSLTLAVSDALWAASLPKGWLPSGPDDPILRAAFDAGWPPELKPEAAE